MQTINLYGIPNCSSVKKARDWLHNHAIDYVFHDFKKITICETLLTHWLNQVSHEKLVNRTGLTWRGLDATTKLSLTDGDAIIKLMQNKPTVIKRPILEKNGKIVSVGFNAQDYIQLFKA